MSSNLSPDNEQFLQRAVSVGMYHDRDEALDRAVELLRRREQLIRDVNKGIEQLDRGEGVPFDTGKIEAAVCKRLEADPER
jgi:Arc/MetJ-type ribon-helix-helix transcriptional regulator